jgi:gluconokinase
MTSNTSGGRNLAPPASQHKHIWVITGPAGCGKTSVAEYLHNTFSLPYLEGDTVSFPHMKYDVNTSC